MESRVREVFGDSGIGLECRANVGMKGFKVHDCGDSENRVWLLGGRMQAVC